MPTRAPSTRPTPSRLHLFAPPPPRPRPNPLELWHLLSLDAPTVAALWTWFIAHANHISLPATSIAAMATAVWLLYAADRLLDARLLDANPLTPSNPPAQTPAAHPLEPRHLFHHHHRRRFRIAIVAASLLLATLLPHLAPETIRLYLIEGSFLIGYFLLIHATPSTTRPTPASPHRLPKELAVGLFFAAAVFIPTVARSPALRLSLLLPAILFSALCTLNCLFINAWEHPAPIHGTRSATYANTHPTPRPALNSLPMIAIFLIALPAACTLLNRHHLSPHYTPWTLPASIALAATLLLLLHHFRHSLPPTTLRAAADLALLTPILFLFS